MEKVFIKNRKGQKVAVVVEEAKPQKGLALVMHGLWSTKDRPGIRSFGDAFYEKGYSVVLFDTTNSTGESDGDYEEATATNYYEDLEDVIAWAKEQKWYVEPFLLMGSSLGGLCVALYAEKHSKEVAALALNAPVISGTLSMATHAPQEIQEWKEKGFILQKKTLQPHILRKRKWQEMEDRLHYDLLADAEKLTMSVFIMVGEKDTSCPPAHQQMLLEKLPAKKELHIIPGMGHGSQDPKHRVEGRRLLSAWIATL